jgi:type I restriction enzyme S subunit
MKENYKRLGDYIQEVNIRNRDLNNIPLLGVSIKKVLMPSIANITGTDMSTYKLIQKNQFAYGPVTSRNGDKISIALLEEYANAMVSQAYTVFEVINENELLPEYLMMWFRRPEFDRYARFMSHGSAREIFSWTEMCETELPIPSPEKQQEIVKEYHIVQNRIALNNQLISKLEETAQAIYKQWFVEFEFPDENGKPYKSNGGKMVWCAEMEKEIPEGWEFGSLGSFTKISAGGDKPKIFSNTKSETCKIPVVSNSSSNEGIYGYTNRAVIFDKCITISARGAIIGYTVLRLNPFVPIVRLIVVKPLEEVFLNYLYYTVLNFKFDNQTSSAQGQLTVPDISSYRVIKPLDSILLKFQNHSSVIINNIDLTKKENQKLEELKNLLLAKMTRVES